MVFTNNNYEYISNLIKKLEELKKKNDKNSIIIILFKIAQYYYNKSDFERAEKTLISILRYNANTPRVNYYLAEIEIMKENEKKAIKYLNKELKINPLDKESKILKEKLIINNNFPYITILLVLLNSIIFYFTFPQINFIQLIKYTGNITNLNFSSLFTSLFFHANLIHFLTNISILLIFGLILEKQIGSLKFVSIYLISGLIANLIEILFSSRDTFILGASGAIFSILGALIIVKPKLKIKLFGIIEIPLIIIFGAYFIFSNFILNLINSNYLNLAQISHITGFLMGLIIAGILYFDKITIIYNWISITMGFYIISIAINNYLIINIIEKNKQISLSLIIFVSLFLLGSYIVYYSYKVLNYLDIEE